MVGGGHIPREEDLSSHHGSLSHRRRRGSLPTMVLSLTQGGEALFPP